MRKKSLYLAPESEVIELKPDGNLLTGSDFGTTDPSVEAMITIEGEWIL